MSEVKVITLAVDGDIYIYRTALKLQEEVFTIKHQGETFIAKSQAGVDRKLKSLKVSKQDADVTRTLELKNDYLDTAKYFLNSSMHKLKIAVKKQAELQLKQSVNIQIVFCIGGKENFRNDIPLFDKYKDRTDERPIALSEVRELAAKCLPSIISDGIEADDLISIFGFKGRQDMSYIAITEDKDAKQTPMWLYIPRLDKLQFCGGFGHIELQTKIRINSQKKEVKTYKLEGYGRSWLYYQLIHGDPVDTYKPFPKNVTDLQYYKMFKDFETDLECWTKIYELYYANYGKVTEYVDWKGEKHQGDVVDIMQNYADVVHMQRWKDDRLNVREILTKYGILCQKQ